MCRQPGKQLNKRSARKEQKVLLLTLVLQVASSTPNYLWEPPVKPRCGFLRLQVYKGSLREGFDSQAAELPIRFSTSKHWAPCQTFHTFAWADATVQQS